MLRNGSTGEEVTALQKSLMAKGINPGPIDGIFGPKTEDAVKRFQERAGLEADGIVGPKTFAALEGEIETPPPADIPEAKKADTAAEEAGEAVPEKAVPETEEPEEPQSPQTAL